MRLDGVVRTAGLLLAGLTMLAAPADAAQGIVTQNINMRAGPGIDYPLVAQLPQGTPAEIFGCLSDFGWCDVAVQDARGWVAGPGLQLLYDDRPEPLVGYGAVAGVPLVGFEAGTYWQRHYRDRPWYHDVDRWRGDGPHGGPPGGFPDHPGFGHPGFGHPVGPAAFPGRPPEPSRSPGLNRPPEPGRMVGPVPGIVTPRGPERIIQSTPRLPSPPRSEPAGMAPGLRPGLGPQAPQLGVHPNPGRPAEPRGAHEPPH